MSKFTMTKEQELGLTGPLKAIAMLVIVFYHACALYTGAWFGEPATPCPELGVFVQWLATVHVPLFLLVSGYIWAYLKMETHKYDDSCVVLKKKVRRLLVPYAVVSLVWAGPVFCLFYGGAATVRAFILGGNPSQLWFLLALFWMFAFAEFLWRAVPRWLGNLPALVALSLGSYFVARCFYALPLDLFQIGHALDYFPCFLLGVWLRQADTSYFWGLNPALPLAVDVMVFAVWFVLNASGGLAVAAKGMFFLLRMLGPLALLSIFGHLPRLIDWFRESLFEWHSFGVYLFHQQIDWLLLSIINVPGVPPVVIVTVLFVVSLAVSLAISMALKRWKAPSRLF